MSPPSTESPAIGAWMQVLDEIQRKLGEALAFDPEASIPVFPALAELGSPLQPLDERLTKLQACLARADADAGQIDAGLQQEAEATQHYLDNLRAAQRKLADWASGAV